MTSSPSPSGPLNSGWTYRDRITAKDAGVTVLAFYARTYPHSAAHTWLERIKTGVVLLDDQKTDPEQVLATGQQLAYHRPPWREPDAPEDFDLLFSDEHLLALAKPAGLQVLPGGPFLERTLLNLVRRRFGDQATPVHRLGRGTSGAMLFARTDASRRHLAAALRQRRIIKIYRTLAQGHIDGDQGIINTPIGPMPHTQWGHLYAAVEEGKAALSQWRCLERRQGPEQSLLEVRIPTGRPHQIRIHLAAIGHPLAGDPLYLSGGKPRSCPDAGRSPRPGDCGYLLHAEEIRLAHPADDRPLLIHCPPPPSLRANRA